MKSIDRVDIVPQVCGEILEIGFQDGEIVKKGDMLYKLDNVRYVAEVKNAEAVKGAPSKPMAARLSRP